MEKVFRALPDVPALEIVMTAFGYRSTAFRFSRFLAHNRKRWADFTAGKDVPVRFKIQWAAPNQ